MTRLLAHTDAYLKEFEAKVVAVNPDDNAVVLTETAFYPRSTSLYSFWCHRRHHPGSFCDSTNRTDRGLVKIQLTGFHILP